MRTIFRHIGTRFRHRAQSFKNLGKGALAVAYYKKANQYESDLSRQLENRNYILEILDKSGDREGYLSAIRDGLQFIEKCYSRLDKYQVFLFVQKCNSENFNTKSYLDSFTTFIETQPKSNDVILVATKAYAYYASGKYKFANRYNNEAERLFANSGYDENDYGKDKERDIAYQKEHTAVIGLLQVFNDIDKQLENQQNTLRKIESLLGKDSRRYKDFEVTIASLNLMYRNNYYDAERLSDSLLSHSAKGSVDYYNAMKLKAVIAIYTGQSLRAAEYYREIAKDETDPRAKYQYLLYDANFVCLDIMRRDMNRSGQDDKARLIADMENTVGKLSSIAEKHFSKTGKDYFDMLNAKALLMYIKHNKSTMMRIVSQMEDIERQTSNPNVKKSELSSLASLYAWNGDFKKALMLLKDDDPEAQTSDRDKYKHYITFASMNLGAGNTSKAIDYYTKGVYYGIDDVRKLFPLMTAAERSTYWNQFKQAFYNAGKYATVFDKENVFNGTLYDLALYSKGLLMRSQNAIVAKIRALGDSSLLEDIQTIQQLRRAVANGKSGTEKQAAMLEDAEKLEKEFLQACVRKGYNIESEFSNYQDVKSKLSAKDAAVEFVLYFDKDTVGHYGALVLRNNYKYPIFVHISEKESLENSLSFDTKTTQTIWNPLLPYFNGIENVYFSPIGKIHKFAIEYLPFNDTEMIADKYNLFRVSSTAELVKRNSTTSFNYTKAVIYGGIYYDTDTITMREVVTDQTRENSGSGVLCYLKGTLKEAQTISSVFKNSHIQVELFDDWSATEESFKRLSGKDNDVIHIGTHGFCKVTDNDLRLAISGSNPQVDGDYAMNNSGLYFSGANNALRGYRAYGLEDGVLTAKEISSLDFSKTDLITLSACVTGDGDITGEGVFGVQRGFKLARANSLVMSCWSVDDNATNLLMSEFYTNLTKGMTKRKSLLEAVKIVKAKYTSPHKWAAFVLLDGLN